MTWKNVYKRDEVKIGLFVGVLVLAAIVRCFFGIETTDEAMYLTESVSIAEWGVVPYATNWFHSSGYAVAAVPFIKLWELIHGDLEGIFLFTRIMYTLVKIVLLIWGAVIVKGLYSLKTAVLFLAPLILFAPGSTSNFSYNTIPFLLEILAACYVMRLVKQEKGKEPVWIAVLVAAACFLNPTNILLAVWWFMVLLVLERKKAVRKNCVWKYTAAGILSACFVCLVLSLLAGGLPVLIEGIALAMKYNPYFHQKEITAATQWQYIRLMLRGLWVFVLLCFICYVSVAAKKEGTQRKKYSVYTGMIIFMLVTCLWYCKSASYIMRVLTGGLIIVPLTLCKMERDADRRLLLIWWFPSVLNLVISAATAYYGIGDRAYLLLPGIIMITLLCAEDEQNGRKAYSLLFSAVLSFALTCSLFGYTYRDANVWNCPARVESGIYKGIFTTYENSEYLTRLETYIKEITSSTDEVFIQQSFPALYLMSEGRMLAPTSWSSLVFADVPYTGDDYIRKYFEFVKREPDIILYHYNNFGPKVQIEDNAYPFCDFINESYEKAKGNEAFPLLELYRRKEPG